MIYGWIVITVCIFFVGYMMGIERGVRAEHSRNLAYQARKQKVKIRPNKGLHLVRKEKLRE